MYIYFECQNIIFVPTLVEKYFHIYTFSKMGDVIILTVWSNPILSNLKHIKFHHIVLKIAISKLIKLLYEYINERTGRQIQIDS